MQELKINKENVKLYKFRSEFRDFYRRAGVYSIEENNKNNYIFFSNICTNEYIIEQKNQFSKEEIEFSKLIQNYFLNLDPKKLKILIDDLLIIEKDGMNIYNEQIYFFAEDFYIFLEESLDYLFNDDYLLF